MNSALEYRPDIDGLRAIAVLAVLGFHAFPQFLPGGFVGVDVFFVISGFLICGIILRGLSRANFSLTGFYARRARRILPALTVVLGACLLLGSYVLLPDEFTRLGKHTAAAAGFVANLTFWKESGYFAPAAQFEPLLHLWSLSIEEQFYLLWPLLLLLAWRRKWSVLWLAGCATVASFGLNLILVDTNETGDFYFPLSRFWELGLGCLLAAAEAQPGPWHSRIAVAARGWLPSWVRATGRQLPAFGMAAIIIATLTFDGHTPYPGMAALIPTLGTACIIGARQSSWLNEKLLSNRALVSIGLISYPLYLWHWPILSFAAILDDGNPPIYLQAAGLLLSLLLAVLTYRIVEVPIRAQRYPAVSVRLGGAIAALGILGLGVLVGGGFPERFGTRVAAIRQEPKRDALCVASVSESEHSNYCRRTNPGAPQVVFLGDSQAQGVYEGAVSTLGRDKPLVLLGRGGCPPVLNVPPSPGVYDSEERRRICNAAWTAFVDYVQETRPETVVVVGDDSRFFGPANSTPGQDPAARASEEAFRTGLTELVQALQQHSRVIYLLEIPTFDTAPSCFLRPVRLPGNNCSPHIRRSALAASRSKYKESVSQVQRTHPGLIVIDPTPALCNAKSCSQISRAGQILYRDEMHLSLAGGQRLARVSGLTRVIADTLWHRGG